MTMALLSLLLGCSIAPAADPTPGPPVAVVVEYSSEPKPDENSPLCNVDYFDLKMRHMDSLEDAKREYAQSQVDRAVRCCTHNGGEHVGWKTVHHNDNALYPVCLYR